jgi:hypothetical protein
LAQFSVTVFRHGLIAHDFVEKIAQFNIALRLSANWAAGRNFNYRQAPSSRVLGSSKAVSGRVPFRQRRFPNIDE